MGDHFAQAEHGTIPALRWEEPPEGPVLVLLDQTRLPQEEVEIVCTDVQALVQAIRSLSLRGAPVLGIAGAYGVALAAARGYDVNDAAELLAHARPTAVNLEYGVRRALTAFRWPRLVRCTHRTRRPVRRWPDTGRSCSPSW
jgi:methylthioribose-1-phosphate isomerase